ncbi:hypothetical protein O6H91_07G063000 [Diphasiastrum complanatum]|uniref:Uncharacterized protein n=2 Tax=Diphasiastrum complanatum TaxID=34168 RepID=A0ACC2D6B0_DIPCM|nr:hypothetical protein O6H91_07G063000 [Diphasiastrum complanatum]KAJ7549695.1 hypothetical protein O6H91_07G063000 [Diphasiastrum complanatum]
MDRLLRIEPEEVVLHFEVGRRCAGMFILRNVMHTMPVAFKVLTTAPRKFGVKPPNGIIGPLGIATVEIVYGAHSDLPENYPFIQDQFLVKSVLAPVGARYETAPNDWFSCKQRQVYSDMSLRIVMVGGSILRSLVSTRSMELVREVLEREVDVDSVDEQQGNTAMHVAIANRRPEMVQLLLEFGANKEIKNREGHTALQEAVLLQDSLSAEVLLSKGADIEAKSPAGCTALHFAVDNKNLELVQILLNHGADVNAFLENGRTPLYLAAANCDTDCVRLLMDRGAKLEAKGSNGSTALHKAAARGDTVLVKLLLSRGAEKKALTCDGKTPYDLAAEAGHRRLYDMLKLGDKLRLGSRQGDLEMVRQCVDQGASVDGQDQYGWSAMHYAAFKGHTDIVQYLIEKGADMECRDEEGYNALHCATEAGHKNVIQLLITKGAKVNVKVKQGSSALQIAQKMKYTGLIQLLSEQGNTKSNETSEENPEFFDTKKENSSSVAMKSSYGFMRTSVYDPDRQCVRVG